MAAETWRELTELARSAASIAGIQAMNFLVPLAALPFIARALGVEPFSHYTVLIAYGAFVVIFVDFSFNVNGPIRVQAAVSQGGLRELVLDSLLLKCALLIPAAVVFLRAATMIGEVAPRDAILALALAVSITLTPRWVVYGRGRLLEFAALSAVSRFSWLGIVVWLVREPDDLPLLLEISVATQAIILAGSFLLIWPKEAWPRPSLRRPARLFRQDLSQFGAILATSASRDLNLVLLSLFVAAAPVANYAVADRVRLLLVGLVAPLTQALYLAIVTTRGDEGRSAGPLRGTASALVLIASAVGGLLAHVFAAPIVLLLGGPEFAGAAPLLRILSLLPLMTALTAILGTNTLLAEGRGHDYALCQLATALLGIPLALLMISRFGAAGAAWSALAVEALLAGLYGLALRRTRLLGKVFG